MVLLTEKTSKDRTLFPKHREEGASPSFLEGARHMIHVCLVTGIRQRVKVHMHTKWYITLHLIILSADVSNVHVSEKNQQLFDCN